MGTWEQERSWVTTELGELTQAVDEHAERLERIECRQRDHSQRMHARDLENAEDRAKVIEEFGRLRLEVVGGMTRLELQIAEIRAPKRVWEIIITGIVVAVVAAVAAKVFN